MTMKDMKLEIEMNDAKVREVLAANGVEWFPTREEQVAEAMRQIKAFAPTECPYPGCQCSRMRMPSGELWRTCEHHARNELSLDEHHACR